MKNFAIMAALVFFLSGCAGDPVIKFVKPPLEDPPLSESLWLYKDPTGGHAWFCRNRQDEENLQKFLQHVRNVKEVWK